MTKKDFTEEDAEKILDENAAKVSEQDVDGIAGRADEIKKRLKKIPGRLGKLVNQVTLMYEMISDYRAGRYTSLPWHTIAVAAAALLYFLNPVDIIPDFIVGLGYVDDALVIGLAVKAAKKDLKRYCEFKGYPLEKYF